MVSRVLLFGAHNTIFLFMAEESGVVVSVPTDLPVKRPSEGKDNGVVSVEMEDTNNISAVIPGWFSEISPMWPGGFHLFISPFFISRFIYFYYIYQDCLPSGFFFGDFFSNHGLLFVNADFL